MAFNFAIIGLGHFGRTVAYELSKTDAEVLVIDNDEHKIDAISQDVAHAVTMDATDVRALKDQNIQSMDAVVVGIGEDFESLLLCVAHLMDLKVPRIVTRASNDIQKAILHKIGVHEIISPEEDVGIIIANKLLSPTFLNFIPLPDGYEIVEIVTPENMVNRTVGEIALREKYNINLITIKRPVDKPSDPMGKAAFRILGVPKEDTRFTKGDILFLLGLEEDIRRLIEINK